MLLRARRPLRDRRAQKPRPLPPAPNFPPPPQIVTQPPAGAEGGRFGVKLDGAPSAPPLGLRPDKLDAVFAVGDRVRIKGLRARPELNGKEGEVRRCTDWVDVHRPPPATGPHGSKSRSWS